MKLFILILIILPSTNGAYMTGSFTVPKHLPIMSQADLLKAVHKPGLLAWRFNIPENSSVTAISLGGLEPLARLGCS
uniref:Secreted protein n=1 Tax=Caenorhabditis tropicalis TaxID=1561998 RepID=A0A1I7U659_9PELO